MTRRAVARARLRQAGLSLVSVLVAILVFALGTLSLASIYSLAVPAVSVNEQAVDTAAFGNQLWGLLQANPTVIASVFGSSSPSTGTSVTYTASSYSGAPALLKPWLSNLFANSATLLPNASVTLTAGQTADSTNCTAASASNTLCGITMSLSWTPIGGATRTQAFSYQIGF